MCRNDCWRIILLVKEAQEVAKLIILSGNSGSGKMSVAKALQEKFGANTMLLSHDVIRREINAVKEELYRFYESGGDI